MLVTLSTTLGCSTLECMRAKPWSDIIKATSSESYDFNPLQDNVTVFTDYEARANEGAIAHLPTLIGGAQREVAAYFNLSSKTINETQQHTVTQQVFNCLIQQSALNRLGRGIPTWRYLYHGNWSNLSPTPWLGAYHSSDLPMIFGTYNKSSLLGSASRPEVLASHYIQSAWVKFAKDPWNGLLSYGWPQFNSQNISLVNLAFYNGVSAKITSSKGWDAHCKRGNFVP